MRAIGCNGELPFPWWFSGWAWSFPSLDSGDVRDLNPTPGLHLSPETFGTVTDRGVGWRETKTERKTWTTLKLLITEGFHRSVLCLFIDNMPLIGCTPFYLSIHQLVNIWIVSTFCLLWIVLLWTLVHKLFLWTCFHFSMYIHLGVELLVTHMVTLCLNFWRIARLFSIWVAPFYIPTSCLWGFQFLHILSDTCCSLSF